MATNPYSWKLGERPPALLRHSSVKHSLLRDYLVDYFLTLAPDPRQDHIRLTIVDGFCGGGRYLDEQGLEVPGSPIIILKAIEEAETRIVLQQKRKKPLVFDIELICIDEDKDAIEYLRWVLEEEGYGDKVISEKIRLLTGKFDNFSEAVISKSRERSIRAGKAIFILDQYGYKNVPLKTLKRIFWKLAKAEVILTFNVDSLINFLNDENLQAFERNTGINGVITAKDMDILTRGPNWRKHIQSKLYSEIILGSGAKHFTPFFIRPAKGHGDFWLLHLSQHSKARDVMASTHWKYNNHFAHYGGPGLEMFSIGYADALDSEFLFNDFAEVQSIESMLNEIPRLLHQHKDGVRFDEFFKDNCNNTPATRAMIESTILKLVDAKEVEVVDDRGNMRGVRTAIQDDDIIRLARQIMLFSHR